MIVVSPIFAWVWIQFRANLLHAAMQINPNRAVRQSSARGYLWAGHALDKPQNQRLPVGIRQSLDYIENCDRRALIIFANTSMANTAAVDFAIVSTILPLTLRRQLNLRHGMPMIVIGPIAGYCRQPRSKAARFAKR